MVVTLEKNQEVVADQPPAFRWTVDEYYRIYNQGLFQDRRVELVHGIIRELPYVNEQIRPTLLRVPEALRPVFGDSYHVGIRIPLLVDEVSEPEPYFMVMDATEALSRAKALKHIALVLEVADNLFTYYRHTKAELYARAGVPEYWILNLKSCELEVLREPVEGAYMKKEVLRETEAVSPLAAPNAKISVKDMLP